MEKPPASLQAAFGGVAPCPIFIEALPAPSDILAESQRLVLSIFSFPATGEMQRLMAFPACGMHLFISRLCARCNRNPEEDSLCTFFHFPPVREMQLSFAKIRQRRADFHFPPVREMQQQKSALISRLELFISRLCARCNGLVFMLAHFAENFHFPPVREMQRLTLTE